MPLSGKPLPVSPPRARKENNPGRHVRAPGKYLPHRQAF
jgi:hypothetical protein